MKTHELKAWPQYFQAVLDGRKTFEVRKNDRGFEVGDELHLVEFDPNPDPDEPNFSGRHLHARVTYVLVGGAFGVEAGHCVLGLAMVHVRLEK